jgi:hypothetical protein
MKRKSTKNTNIYALVMRLIPGQEETCSKILWGCPFKINIGLPQPELPERCRDKEKVWGGEGSTDMSCTDSWQVPWECTALHTSRSHMEKEHFCIPHISILLYFKKYREGFFSMYFIQCCFIYFIYFIFVITQQYQYIYIY